MSDFFQTGAVATLHRLGKPNVERLERELERFSEENPIALVLPCHVRELGTPALRLILERTQVHHLHPANHRGHRRRDARGGFRAGASILRAVAAAADAPVERRPADPAPVRSGRGGGTQSRFSGYSRNVWTCFGYVLASEQARMVAVHDCDITTYSRELLARLCYPVAHPSLGFDFCKGYYARV